MARELQTATRGDRVDARFDAFRIDRIWCQIFQTQHHCAITAMALARGAERTIQLGLDAHDRLLLAEHCSRLGESGRSAHRPDGVRARRTNADLKEVENRNAHGLTATSTSWSIGMQLQNRLRSP